MSNERDTFAKTGISATAFADGVIVLAFWDTEFRQQVIDGLQAMSDDEHYIAFAPKDFDATVQRARLIEASEQLGDAAPPRTGRPRQGGAEV